ncbi:MAG: hypothetical protein WDO18_12470 [Acidobacteriota bacterium]
MVGEYSIRGGILDVFGAENSRPLRVEFFGDEVESIRRFEVESQRSVLKVTEAEILPLREHPQDDDNRPGWEFTAALEKPRSHSLFDLTPKAIVLLDEPGDIKSAGRTPLENDWSSWANTFPSWPPPTSSLGKTLAQSSRSIPRSRSKNCI